jgi:hypothetical protein
MPGFYPERMPGVKVATKNILPYGKKLKKPRGIKRLLLV